MQRRSVDLPLPDEPIRQTTSCSATVEVDPAQDLERRRTTCGGPRSRSAGRRVRRVGSVTGRRARGLAARGRARRSQSVSRASGIVTTMKTRAIARNGVKLKVADLRIWACAEDLDDADDRHEHRVLLEADEVVEERRDHPPDGLRDDDVAQGLEPAEPERARRGLLARVDRLDARPVDLRHVGRVDEGQGDDAPEERSFGTPAIPRPGMPKPSR